MMGYGYGWNGWMVFVMLAWPLAVAAAVWAVAVLTRGVSSPPAAARGGAASPLEILDRRLADGEISVAEFHEIREALIRTAPAGAGGPH